jgi:hypothetical protein
MTKENLDRWIAVLHGIEQCGRHEPNSAWLGCTECCRKVAEEIERLVRSGLLRLTAEP